MPVQLQCVSRAYQGHQWVMDLDGDRVIVTDAAGNALLNCSHEQAIQRFQMPSFSESIKYFGIACDDGSYLQFNVSRSGLNEIKTFLDRKLIADGPEAVLGVRKAAIRDTLIGLGITCGGILLSIGSFIIATLNPDGGHYYVLHGVVLFGLVMLGKGIYGFFRYRRILRLAESFVHLHRN